MVRELNELLRVAESIEDDALKSDVISARLELICRINRVTSLCLKQLEDIKYNSVNKNDFRQFATEVYNYLTK